LNRRKTGGCGDFKLILLIVISVIGLVLSTVIHFCSLFHIYEPSRGLMILINIGIMVVFYPAYIISKKTRNELNVKDFNKAIFDACPGWLSIMTGLLIMYALGGLTFFILKRYFASSAVTNGQEIISNGFRGFSGHWMALYSLAFALLYSCRCLKSTR
jgi:hypothetical protein